MVKRVDYDSFGNIINDTDPSFTVAFGFAGGLYDHDIDLVRFGFRDYDHDIGRWTAKDPILFEGGDTDLYGYCLNDSINWADPSGEAAQVIAPVVITVGAIAAITMWALTPQDQKEALFDAMHDEAKKLWESLFRKKSKEDPNLYNKEKQKLKQGNACQPPEEPDPKKNPPPPIKPTDAQKLAREPLWGKLLRVIKGEPLP